MKSLKKILFTSAVIAGGYGLASAAPGTLAAEGIVDASDPGASPPNWASMTVVPAPSSTDLLNGIVGTQIGSRLSVGGGAINIASYTDGSGATADINQIPADFPGVNLPAVSVFWPLASASTVAAVTAYCHNWNGGTPDIRSVPVIVVFTTTDVSVTAGSTWTQFNTDKAYTAKGPLNLEWFTPEPAAAPYGETPTTHANAIVVGNDTGAAIATGVTGVRVDVYCAGFGSEMRNPENVASGAQAVSAPYIAEIDALTVSPFPSAVNDWTIY